MADKQWLALLYPRTGDSDGGCSKTASYSEVCSFSNMLRPYPLSGLGFQGTTKRRFGCRTPGQFFSKISLGPATSSSREPRLRVGALFPSLLMLMT